jgi:hypothetical protein
MSHDGQEQKAGQQAALPRNVMQCIGEAEPSGPADDNEAYARWTPHVDRLTQVDLVGGPLPGLHDGIETGVVARVFIGRSGIRRCGGGYSQ